MKWWSSRDDVVEWRVETLRVDTELEKVSMEEKEMMKINVSK